MPGAQPMKAIGYYYEDDDDYDMKTMYINDGGDQADGRTSSIPPVSHNHATSNDPSAKDEMFERLRRINQHMYR